MIAPLISLCGVLQVTALAFSPDGQILASGSEDGSMMVWDLKDARRFGVAPSHTGPVWSLAFSQGEGAILASGLPCAHHSPFTGTDCMTTLTAAPVSIRQCHAEAPNAWQLCPVSAV